MSDNLKDKGPRDRSRISLSEEWEMNYWAEALNCSREELKEAVEKVGNSADEVRIYLQK
jgi:hypothetical protein